MSSLASSNPVTLGYWRIRGLAAHIRMLFEFLDVPFVDVAFTQGGAPEFSRAEWLAVKHTLPLSFPNLPFLLDGDVKITQSVAIFNFVAKKYGPAHADRLHLPKTLLEETEHDMLLHVAADFADAIASVAYSPHYDALLPEFVSNVLPAWLDQFSRFLAAKTFLLGGDRPSPVDFFLFELLDRSVLQVPSALNAFPALAAFHSRVKTLPQLRRYFTSAAASWPINNTVARFR
jgi:glutathione S-transferase